MVKRCLFFLFLMFGLSVTLCFAEGFWWKGDFRLRSEWMKYDERLRFRERIRLRFSIFREIDRVWVVGFGVATGGDDPRSTNETLDNSLETPDLRLDHAHVEFVGLNGVCLWGGKYKSVKEAIFCVSDFLWDFDLRPEGVGGSYRKKWMDREFFANAGVWLLDERKRARDPFLIYAQPGFTTERLKAYIACYDFRNIKGICLDHSSGTNTCSEGGGLKYGYRVLSSGVRVMFWESTGFNISIFSEYAVNTVLEKDDEAYLIGVEFVKDAKLRLKFSHRKLEKDAWLDIFPDSDAFSGKTGVEGQEMVFKWEMTKHVSFCLDFYHLSDIYTASRLQLVQMDLVWKF